MSQPFLLLCGGGVVEQLLCDVAGWLFKLLLVRLWWL